jgi:hypothetical protein
MRKLQPQKAGSGSSLKARKLFGQWPAAAGEEEGWWVLTAPMPRESERCLPLLLPDATPGTEMQ